MNALYRKSDLIFIILVTVTLCSAVRPGGSAKAKYITEAHETGVRSSNGTADNPIYLPLVANGSSTAAFTIEQTLSDGAQRDTIAFDGLAFLTGNLGADSFFPPGKVADFWGFQYLRDNDPSSMGHNTDFLTRASLNMLYVLTPTQRASLITLAQSQVESINQYANNRFALMKAFDRLLSGDIPSGSSGLDKTTVMSYSAQLYRLDGQISYARAQVMGSILRQLNTTQKNYLSNMAGKGMFTWPVVGEPTELRGLDQDVKVAVMTYAGDLFSWYAGSVTADVYFCPERQGTYFGSFYLKDAPAVGNPNYTIPSNLTADLGQAFLKTLTTDQSAKITGLVSDQKTALYAIVDRRKDVSTLLRQFISGTTPDQATVLSLMEQYGELDGDIIYRYATAFTQISQSLTADQRTQIFKLRIDLLQELSYPSGAFLYSQPISLPVIPNTDFLFSTK
jgi:Spy/CpxP family protein refolding chaperone